MRDKNGRKITLHQYNKARVLGGEYFKRYPRLMAEYMVVQHSRELDQRLKFIREEQLKSQSRLAQKQEVVGAGSGSHGDDPVNRKAGTIYCPSSIVSSPRYKLEKYQDSLALHTQFGNPTFLLTITANPNWPEIRTSCENAVHGAKKERIDLINMSFNTRVTFIVRMLKAGLLFGPVDYVTGVREFQKRGLPHVHIIIKLKNTGTLMNTEVIDQYISAELPDKEEPLRFVLKLT
jgi:hypothetical protein